jgi:hypothetical protein
MIIDIVATPFGLTIKDPSLDRLTGLGGFLTESVSIPSESWYCL